MATTIRHLTQEELQAGIAAIREAPRDGGVLELIVRRPPTELFDEGDAVTVSFSAEHCVLLEA